MDLARGYNLSPSVLFRLRLLDWIADNGGPMGVLVDLAPLFNDQEPEDAEAIAGSLRFLREDGLIGLNTPLGYRGWSCFVRPAGLGLIEKLRTARGDLLGRRKAARDAFLSWLHDRTLHGDPHPQFNDFYASDYGTYYGHEFTSDEINTAARWLMDEGYIKGTATFGGGLARPSITTRGERVLESGRSVNDFSPAAANMPTAPSDASTVNNYFNVTGSPGAAIAANSPGTVQTVTVTMTEDNRRQVAAVADQLEALVRLGALGLDEEQTAQAEAAVAELRQVTDQPVVEPGVVRRALESAKDVAVSGTGSVIGQGVVAAVTQALQAMGL
ncbi:hypothetical protein [Geodermatophilus sp. SYSU D00696]